MDHDFTISGRELRRRKEISPMLSRPENVALLLALGPIVILRTFVGQRLVEGKLVTLAAVMAVWYFVWYGIRHMLHCEMHNDVPFEAFCAWVLVAGCNQRIAAALGEQSRPRTHALGVSRLQVSMSWLTRGGDKLERFVDPIVVVNTGIAVFLCYPTSSLSEWLCLSGAGLLLIERHARRIELRQFNQLVEANREIDRIIFQRGVHTNKVRTQPSSPIQVGPCEPRSCFPKRRH